MREWLENEMQFLIGLIVAAVTVVAMFAFASYTSREDSADAKRETVDLVKASEIVPPPRPARQYEHIDFLGDDEPIKVDRAIAAKILQTQAKLHDEARRAMEDVELFFRDAALGIEPFCSDMLGLKSKYLIVVDSVRGTQRHRQFVQESFETNLFSKTDLEESLERVANRVAQTMQSTENELLVAIQADLAMSEPDLPADWLDRDELIKKINQALQTGNDAAEVDIMRDGEKLALSEVTAFLIQRHLLKRLVGRILQQVARRLFVSTGILGTGAALGPESLGVTIVAGIIVDQMVSAVWNWFDNPYEKLGNEIQGHLDEMQAAIIHGQPGQEGLNHALRVFVDQRIKAIAVELTNSLSKTP